MSRDECRELLVAKYFCFVPFFPHRNDKLAGGAILKKKKEFTTKVLLSRKFLHTRRQQRRMAKLHRRKIDGKFMTPRSTKKYLSWKLVIYVKARHERQELNLSLPELFRDYQTLWVFLNEMRDNFRRFSLHILELLFSPCAAVVPHA